MVCAKDFLLLITEVIEDLGSGTEPDNQSSSPVAVAMAEKEVRGPRKKKEGHDFERNA
jgi:hypothetical protein